MRFTLIDRVTELQPGERIAAVKNLSLGEEYLADHFPGFPVMPGVLMLEAMTQASAWLVRASDEFAHSIVTLKEARNVRFANFVKPAQSLQVTAKIINHGEHETKLSAEGKVDDRPTVSARLVLSRYNLAERDPNYSDSDARVIKELRNLFAVLWNPD